MNTTLKSALAFAGGLLAASPSGWAQAPERPAAARTEKVASETSKEQAAPRETPPPPATATAKQSPPRPEEPASAAPASSPTPVPKDAPRSASEGVKGMAREFGEQSKDLLKKRKALLERLRLARTQEEKQRIVAELRQQQKQRLEQQREVARQIREQMQNKRSEMSPASTRR